MLPSGEALRGWYLRGLEEGPSVLESYPAMEELSVKCWDERSGRGRPGGRMVGHQMASEAPISTAHARDWSEWVLEVKQDVQSAASVVVLEGSAGTAAATAWTRMVGDALASAMAGLKSCPESVTLYAMASCCMLSVMGSDGVGDLDLVTQAIVRKGEELSAWAASGSLRPELPEPAEGQSASPWECERAIGEPWAEYVERSLALGRRVKALREVLRQTGWAGAGQHVLWLPSLPWLTPQLRAKLAAQAGLQLEGGGHALLGREVSVVDINRRRQLVGHVGIGGGAGACYVQVGGWGVGGRAGAASQCCRRAWPQGW